MIQGTVQVTGKIAPTHVNDVFPTHDSIYGKGDKHVVDTTERDAIPEERRYWGMLCHVRGTSGNTVTYQLKYGEVDTVITNDANWSLLVYEAGGIYGTIGYVPIFTAADEIGDSVIFQDGGLIGISDGTAFTPLKLTHILVDDTGDFSVIIENINAGGISGLAIRSDADDGAGNPTDLRIYRTGTAQTFLHADYDNTSMFSITNDSAYDVGGYFFMQVALSNQYFRLVSDDNNYTQGLVGCYFTGTPTGQIGIGLGAADPDAVAILDIVSTTKGVLFPRMTAVQASAITPVEGLMLFATTTNGTFTSVGLWCYEAAAWSKK